MNELPWFRLYHEIATDPVVKLLAFDDQRHFIWSLCMKASGLLDREFPTPQLRERAIAGYLGVSLSTADEVRRRLLEVGLIDAAWHPVNWDKRQMRSDSSTDRVREHRERKRREAAEAAAAAATQGGETQVKRYSNGLEGEGETEKEIPPQPTAGPPRGSPPAEQAAGRKGRTEIATATRLPADFELTPERRQVAQAEGLDPERTFAKFTAHYRSVAGARGRKADWDAAWTAWCLDELDRGPAKGKPPAPTGPPAPTAEQAQLAIARSTAARMGLDWSATDTLADLDRKIGDRRLQILGDQQAARKSQEAFG